MLNLISVISLIVQEGVADGDRVRVNIAKVAKGEGIVELHGASPKGRRYRGFGKERLLS
jgi:hypothetical protein